MLAMRIVAFRVEFPLAAAKILGFLDAGIEPQASPAQRFLSCSAGQNRASVYVEDFPGNEACELGAQEQHRGSDLLRASGPA
jgi:hypothetical protein